MADLSTEKSFANSALQSVHSDTKMLQWGKTPREGFARKNFWKKIFVWKSPETSKKWKKKFFDFLGVLHHSVPLCSVL